MSIVHSIEESLGEAFKFDKVTWLLFGVRSFVVEGIKTRTYLIFEAFEILGNVHKMGTCIRNFKDLLTTDINRDQESYVNHLATFVTSIQSLAKEVEKRQSLPYGPKIKQVQAVWKDHVELLISLKENATFLDDIKTAILFKAYDIVKELEGPPPVKDSTLLSYEELETDLSKLRDKWAEEFNSFSDLYGYNMCMWTIDYVNLNHFILIFQRPVMICLQLRNNYFK